MRYLFLFSVLICCAACNWAKQKTKDTINKGGEMVAKAGSEFADGAARGIEKTFSNEVVVSDGLKKQGLKTGRIVINSTDSTTENVLTAYLIFDNSLDRTITAKLFDTENKEYGRVTVYVKAAASEARYVDFAFDKRTNIDYKGKVLFE